VDIIREIRCGDSEVCKECKVVGRGKPLLFEPVEERPAIMLISQAPGDPQKLGYADVHEWLYEVSFIPSLFDKAHKKFSLTQDWKCAPAYWTHLGKCFPGAGKGGHIPPPKACANEFLLRELRAAEPVLVIGLGGKVWDFFRKYTRELSDYTLTDCVKWMTNDPSRSILINIGKLNFELIILPHPGKSGSAYWGRKGLKGVKQTAVRFCQNKIGARFVHLGADKASG
jgi:uracil-DNA glycosylase